MSDYENNDTDSDSMKVNDGKDVYRNVGLAVAGLGTLLVIVGGIGGLVAGGDIASVATTSAPSQRSADIDGPDFLSEGNGGPGGNNLGPSPQLDMAATTCSGAGICGRYVRGRSCQCNDKCEKYRSCCGDYKSACTGYHPADPSLLQHSSAPLLTFYMYRTQNDDNYPPLNTNLASLGGVLWYLQNEIVNRCDSGRGGGQFGYRRFKKTRILRYKASRFSTDRLRFQPGCQDAVAFKIVIRIEGAYPDKDNWRAYDKYGYNVGCNTLGLGPYPTCPSPEGDREGFCPLKYPAAYWYSMPGTCPSQRLGRKSSKCMEEEPGGYCKGEPTGQGNCTWTYWEAGDINIDELVGIKPPAFKDHMDFCRRGCLEYVKYGWGKDKGKCGITWWDNRFDQGTNQWRMDQVDNAFYKKFPTMPREAALPPPDCDFNKNAFYQGL